MPSPPLCNPECAALSTALFAPRTNLGCQPAEADEISSGGRTFMSDIAAYQKFLRAFVAAAFRGGRFGVRRPRPINPSSSPLQPQKRQPRCRTQKVANFGIISASYLFPRRRTSLNSFVSDIYDIARAPGDAVRCLILQTAPTAFLGQSSPLCPRIPAEAA